VSLARDRERIIGGWGPTFFSPSRFAVRDGPRVSAMSRAARGHPTFREHDVATKAPRCPMTWAPPRKRFLRRRHRLRLLHRRRASLSRKQREGSEVRGRVRGPSRVAEVGTKLVRGSRSDGRRSGFRSRRHSRVCGEESLGDQDGFAETKVTAGRFGNDRGVRGLVERKYGRKKTPPCRRSIRRSKSGP
jgi:hypothetical protein